MDITDKIYSSENCREKQICNLKRVDTGCPRGLIPSRNGCRPWNWNQSVKCWPFHNKCNNIMAAKDVHDLGWNGQN